MNNTAIAEDHDHYWHHINQYEEEWGVISEVIDFKTYTIIYKLITHYWMCCWYHQRVLIIEIIISYEDDFL